MQCHPVDCDQIWANGEENQVQANENPTGRHAGGCRRLGNGSERVGENRGNPDTLVGNSTGDTISVIDVVAKKTIATVTVGNVVHAVCSQGDGRKAFTTIESENALKVIDTATNKLTDTIALTGRPNECASTEDGHYVVVPIVTDTTADIGDMTQKKVVKTLPIKGPHNCFSPVGGSNDVIYCEERRGYDSPKLTSKPRILSSEFRSMATRAPLL